MGKNAKIYAAFGMVLVGGYAIYRIVAFASGTPKDFEDARLRGGAISQDIVNISGELKNKLAEINELDRQGDYTEALVKATEATQATEEIRKKAVDLSTELQLMTSSLPKIKNADAKEAVLESVSNRLALIGHLINYSSYLSDLTNVLRDKFSGNYQKAGRVGELVTEINAEVTAINAFNQSAIAAMDRFDRLQ